MGKNLVGMEIKQLWIFKEEDGTTILQWCQGIVVAVKTRDHVHIQWSEDCLQDGNLPISEGVFKKSQCNKHVEGEWRMCV